MVCIYMYIYVIYYITYIIIYIIIHVEAPCPLGGEGLLPIVSTSHNLFLIFIITCLSADDVLVERHNH